MIREPRIVDVAMDYLKQGWLSIPIAYREKKPEGTDWSNWRLDTPEKIAAHFNGGPSNIGVLLGAVSGNLIDVDLDYRECLPFARLFLPVTRQFGRETNPVSHWLYRVIDPPNRIVFMCNGTDDPVVLEIRGNKHQSVFPPSAHKETGERILWVGQQPLAKMSFTDLNRLCGRVAAGAVLARHWPREKGNRHECALALAGILLHSGFTIDDAEQFIGIIAKIAGNDGELHTNTVKATKQKIDSGEKVTGWRRLAELLNVRRPIENIPDWLGYSPHAESRTDSRNARHGDSSEENSADPDLDGPKKTAFANLNNAVKVMQRDPDFCSVWFDEFLDRVLTGDPPREWKDADDIDLALRFQRDKAMPRMSTETAAKAVVATAFRSKKNCVKDWLESLTWDGEERLEHFFEDYYGTERTAYHQAAGKNFLLSMVARIYRPGCQVDTMPVLEGPQGIFKSSSLRTLAGDYHAEQHENVMRKDFLENLQGKWLIEISEMDSFRKGEITKVKAVITTTKDYFRSSYGRRSCDHPRQCVFVATTNRDDWNVDDTGARRFWPIRCRHIDLVGIKTNRDQLFAEAVVRFKRGESWWEMPAEETKAEQESRYIDDVWFEAVAAFVYLKTDTTITNVLIDCLKFELAEITKREEMRVATILRRLGWRRGGSVRDPNDWRKQVRVWFST